MRSKILTPVLASALMLFGTAAAQAGTLTSATWFGSFQGTPFTLSTANGGLVVSGTSSGTGASVALTVASTSGGAPHFVTISPGTPSVRVEQTLGGTQAINIGGSGATVAINQGVPGGVEVDIAGLTDTAFGNLFTIPLSVGAGGTSHVTVTNALAGKVQVGVTFIGWQTGAFTFNGSTSAGVAVPTPFMTAGSFNLTAGGGGSITLVAPSIVKVTIKGAPNSTSAGATKLTLNFMGSVVPEPGTLLLLGAGLGGLAIVGRRRRS